VIVGAARRHQDLLTRERGSGFWKQTEAVLYDKLVSPEILALANPKPCSFTPGSSRGYRKKSKPKFMRGIYGCDRSPARSFGEERRHVVLAAGGTRRVDVKSKKKGVRSGGSDAESTGRLKDLGARSGGPSRSRISCGAFTVLPGHRQAVKEIDCAGFRHTGNLRGDMGGDNRAAIATADPRGRPAGDP